ncbi:MAG: type VII secretion integral membrane protein EccD [Hamadaea sp.]|uniref:type VII secretion integral membrane protein EccD n=1 Tax=Hamadaea sp. TaxID=2024425 RepID=UPI00185CFEE6|nr:type VII secretion integral membrane protein EccD [Hamadaea sp.]NUT20407.1 type VII secretion integral membrane protein EccD [Hamadaea sp.]
MVEQTGLARIIVIAPHRRVEMAVPEHVPLAGVLPAVLRHAGRTLAEDGVDHGGWVLRRIDGGRLDPARSLAAQEIFDGETLVLAPRDQHWPEPAFDDVAEAIAERAGRLGLVWSAGATVRTGWWTAAVVLAAGLVLLASTPANWLTGLTSLLVAAVLLGTAVIDERIDPGLSAARLTAPFAMFYAALGAVLISAPAPGELMRPWPLTAGLAGLLLAAVVGRALVRDDVFFTAGATFGACLAVVAVLAAIDWATVEGAAAVVGGVAALALMTLPRWAMAAGGVPTPPVPTLTGQAEAANPPADLLGSAVRRSDRLLTGLLGGACATLATCAVLLAMHASGAGLGLIGAIGLICALRSRAFATVRHRVPLLAVGLLALVSLLWYAWSSLSGSVGVTTAVVAAGLAVALIALAAGRRFARRTPSPQLGRLGDWATFLATAAVPILAALVLGLFGFMRGLGG